MSSLRSLEKKSLESFLQMSGGNVSNFTVRQLNEFVEECTGIDLDNERFKTDGESKARRLRAFWKLEPDAVVGKLIHALIEYVLAPENQPTDEQKALETRCNEIANRLLADESDVLHPSQAHPPRDLVDSPIRRHNLGSLLDHISSIDDVGHLGLLHNLVKARLTTDESVPLAADVTAAPLKLRSSFFINYRRNDASAEAHLVKNYLEGVHGSNSVFMDVSSIPAGAKWPEMIRQKLDTSDTVVVIIGPDWLTACADQWGRRRIDDESDWVRMELERALKSGKRVIPLLVRGATLPPEKALPSSLKELLACQCIEVRRDYWNHDIKLLETALNLPARPTGVTASSPPKPTDIKRERDINQLRKVFHWIHLGVMGVYLERLGQLARATNAGVFMYERLRDLLADTRFYLSDKELRKRVEAFVTAFGKSQKYAGNMEPGEQEGHFYMPGDIFQSREQEKQVNHTMAQAEPLRKALEDLKAYVAENYVEIDLATTGEEGFKEYEEYEAMVQAALKWRPKA